MFTVMRCFKHKEFQNGLKEKKWKEGTHNLEPNLLLSIVNWAWKGREKGTGK